MVSVFKDARFTTSCSLIHHCISHLRTMADKKLQEFIARNEEYIEHHQCPPFLKDIISVKREHGSTCIKAKVIRNAGGRAVDAKRSLAVMGTIAPLAMIVVVHHTDCGGLFTTDEEVYLRLRERAPDHAHEIKNMRFGTFTEWVEFLLYPLFTSAAI
ncbi:hypothetical protein BN1708_015248, partial [Verticillium longisporum]